MPKERREEGKPRAAAARGAHISLGLGGLVLIGAGAYLALWSNLFSIEYTRADGASSTPRYKAIDPALYNLEELALAHIDPSLTTLLQPQNASSTLLAATTTASSSVAIAGKAWPAPSPYPAPGALLPAHRIVAYYGNFYSTAMGVLGEYPADQVLAMLASTSAEWEAADPATPVIPAIDYIAVTAQAAAGADGKYRARMPASQIEQAIAMASQLHGIVILDVQVGLSDLPTELPLLAPYLSLPNVNLAIDPEFSMQTSGARPGTVIGTYSAKDIDYAIDYLDSLVKQNDLPPKILVVHRFTEDMVTNYQNITPLPDVQVVMDMDGWGDQAKKINTYERVIASEPVEFTGFKLFYKADLKPPSTGLLAPAQVLALTPAPIFIQYQ
ncbi:MAG TPA: hypothetical protein VHC68_01215 [Candidatus Paceibacterota bacterium]|nr:hypothetical protein [Candidatus Paceibacterota bacterium]